MLTSSLKSRFVRLGPPSKTPSPANDNPTPGETFESARANDSDHSLSKTLKAMSALALVASPQLANAAEAVEQASVEIQTDQPEESIIDSLERVGDGIGDTISEKAEQVRQTVDPYGYLNERTTKIGDYDLRFRPMDVDLKPKLKSGVPGLRLKGEFLETSIAKTDDVGDGWTRRQGFSAKLEGEVTTYGSPKLHWNAGVFREYRGIVGEDYQARFQTNLGFRQNFIGEDDGLSGGIGFRQEIEGGQHSLWGHDYQIYAEGRQGAYYNFDKGETNLSYSFMVGPKKDFEIGLFGRKGKLTITAGPEVKGNSTGDPFDFGFKTKARFRLTK